MSVFKNKHVVTAMIVAPLLAVMSYFAVDMLVKEQPQVAQAGQAYKLVAKSNCRYSSGQCDLHNASFKSTLMVDPQSNLLKINASHALQNATIGFVDSQGNEVQPVELIVTNSANTEWQMALPSTINQSSLARVVLRANNALYYVETNMTFVDYKTGFERDFR